MKIALVHEFLNQWGGAERVLDALHELYPKAPVFTLMHDAGRTAEHFKDWDIRTSFLQRPWISGLRKYALPIYPLAAESWNFDEFDVVISSSNSFAKGIITRPETLHICYCHTPTAYLWSWTHQYLAEQRLGSMTGAGVRLMLHGLRSWDRLAAERVDRWIANSKNVQERIRKYYRKESSVIYPPVDIDRFSISSEIDDHFLYISRLSGYKRPELVVRAFNELGLPLIVVGEGDERVRVQSMARPNIRFTGWLPDREVAQYIARTRAVIFPVEEDFGLVPVEAMAAGRPVIAFGRGGARETIIEAKTGLFFNEATAESLMDTVNKFISVERQFGPQLIRKHAQKFDQKVFLGRMSRFVEQAWDEYRQ